MFRPILKGCQEISDSARFLDPVDILRVSVAAMPGVMWVVGKITGPRGRPGANAG